METRNSQTLADFVGFCQAHPEYRFWQALRNWAGVGFIFAGDLDKKPRKGQPELDIIERLGVVGGLGLKDTFYREGKDD